MNDNSTPFKPGWISVPLPGHRYSQTGIYSYNSLPPVIQTAYSSFNWLTVPDSRIVTETREFWPSDDDYQKHKQAMLALYTSEQHVILPNAFFDFFSIPDLFQKVPFSDYTFSLSPDILESSLFHGLYFVQFMIQPYSPLKWFICANNQKEHCVVVSLGADLDKENPHNRWLTNGQQIDYSWILENTYFCASNFLEFMYRFWLENYIYMALSLGIELKPEQVEYLAHYTNNR